MPTKRQVMVGGAALAAVAGLGSATQAAVHAGTGKSLLHAVSKLEPRAFIVIGASGRETVGHFPDESFESIGAALMDTMIDFELDGEKSMWVALSPEAYKRAVLGNLIDYIPDAEGDINIPTLLGYRVTVPGTKAKFNKPA